VGRVAQSVQRLTTGWTVRDRIVQSTTSRQGERLSVRFVVFSLRSAVKVTAESVECLLSVV